MSIKLSERRLIENEMIFRRANESIVGGLDDLDALNIEEGTPDLIRTEDMVLHFLCECSDEDCLARIPLKLSVYQKIHENRHAFIVRPKHVVHKIEKVIQAHEKYSVVEKNNSVPEPTKKLNKTSIQNTKK